MSEVWAKLSSVLVNNLNVSCKIQNGVKNDFEISFWVAERLECDCCKTDKSNVISQCVCAGMGSDGLILG